MDEAAPRVTAGLVGVMLAIAVGLMATVVGLDRERGFYPTVMIAIAFLYPLFAVLGESTRALLLESVVSAVFVALTIAGFRSSLWLVAFALAAHGGFDLVHARLIANPGVPAYWPAFCMAYDVTAAAYLGWLIRSNRMRAA